MFYENDLISRQIESLVQIASKILFGLNCVSYKKSGKYDELYEEINSMINAEKFGEAEDILYDNFDISDDEFLILAIDYYHRLNSYNDETLDNADFSRDEVRDGLFELMKKCGIPEDAMTV